MGLSVRPGIKRIDFMINRLISIFVLLLLCTSTVSGDTQIFKEPVKLQLKMADPPGSTNLIDITFGTPFVVDWDGDGLKDLIVGCKGGYVLWYRNIGTKNIPQFENKGVELRADGKIIKVGTT